MTDHDAAQHDPAPARALVLALPVPGAEPTDQLAGLSLVSRTVLRLARAGVTDVLVAIAEGDQATRDALADPRMPSATTIIEVATAAEAFREAAQRGAGPVLVARYHVVAENGVYEALLGARSGTADLVRCAEIDPRWSPFVATTAALSRLADSGSGSASDSDPAIPVPGVVRPVTDEADRRFVFDALFEACRKPVDGLVSRHLNRHVSIWISKRIVNTPVTPNQMSIITFLLGVGAAVSVSVGTYTTMLAGALLLQANSILDGVDGELARVRFQQSKLGEWVDTVSDDLSNALFYGGLALAAAKLPGPGPTLATLGAVAVALQLGTMALYYTELARLGRGDFYALGVGGRAKRPRGLVAAIITAVGYVTKKDFFIFAFLVAAALGVLPWALVPIGIGTTLTFLAGLSLLVKRGWRRRQA